VRVDRRPQEGRAATTRRLRARVVSTAVCVFAALPCPVVLAYPHARSVVGRIADVRPQPAGTGDERSEVLVVRTAHAGDVEVTVDRTTHYLKWIRRPPWQQDTRATATLLQVGRLVSVEVPAGTRTARLVRIAID
jgi:hypothetical protein